MPYHPGRGLAKVLAMCFVWASMRRVLYALGTSRNAYQAQHTLFERACSRRKPIPVNDHNPKIS